MLNFYMQPIYVAMIVFSIISVMIFIPWLIYIYRKYGYFPFSTTIIVFSFIFYFMAAFFLTLLPMPESRHNCTNWSGNGISLVPLQFVDDILRESRVDWSRPATYAYLLKERAFLQAFLNLLLLMPLGVYLRYYFGARRAWWKALLIIGAVTLFYEVTQLTGIYGIYDCPYRVFDVDDLMLNSVGGLIGFFIAPIILALFPSRAKVREKAALLMERDEVRNMVVFLAMAIDLAFIQLAVRLISFLSGYTDEWSHFFMLSAMLIVFLVVLPAITGGRTIGTGVMRFRYTGERLKIKLFKRMLAILLVYMIQFAAKLTTMIEVPSEGPHKLDLLFNMLGFVVSGLLVLVLVIHTIVVLFSREKRRFFFDTYAQITTTRRKRADDTERES